MDEQSRKKYPSLPPDYVTIAMLRKRWLQRQEDQNLNEQQEQEVLEETQNLENECQNQPHEELRHRFENNGPRKRMEKDGGEMGLIEEKGKGEEIMIGCYGNGKVSNQKYHSKNKKHGADWKRRNEVNMEALEKRQNPRGKEGLDLDEKKNGCEGVEITPKNKVKVGITGFLSGETGGTEVIGEIGSVKMTEVLPKDGVKEADWKRRNEVNMEALEKRQNPRGKEGLDLDEKKNGCEGVEITPKNKVKVGITGFLSGETGGTEVIGEIGSVKMTEVLPKDGVKEGSSEISTTQNVRRVGFRGGFRRKENNREAGFRSKEYRVKVRELKDNNSLGKEDEVLEIDRKGNVRKWRKRRGKGDKFKQSRAEMGGLELNEVELKPKDEIPWTGSERDGMKGLHSCKGRNDTKQNRVNGEALTADTVLLENKAENTVLEDKSRNDGWRGNLRENFEDFTIDNRKGRYLGSKGERKYGGNRRHVNSRRFEADRKMKQTDSGMVWVKKEQPGAVADEVGSMGVPLINSS